MSTIINQISKEEQRLLMRERLGLSRPQAAQLLNVSHSFYVRWERGKTTSSRLDSELLRLYQKYHKLAA